ncbi:MAG: Nramp family divalent metal transporter [Acidimicrobiia bacterium]
MADVIDRAEPVVRGYQLGVSRPDLAVLDLPTPEEVFGVPRVGGWNVLKFVIGPSLIALGISIGSGEWLLGPLSVGQYGFVGVGWVITLSILLQTFYNVEHSRYVLATGEVPVVFFGRTPPGYLFWVPFSVLVIFFAFIWGGWAASAGDGLFALFTGRLVETEGDEALRNWLATGLLFLVFVIAALSRVVTRGLELVNWVIVGFIIAVLALMDIFLVPASIWWEGIRGLFTPAALPEGITAREIGGLAGFAALASGLNWYVMNHYRDHGYGMSHRVGYIAGLRGVPKEVLAVGVTFPEDERNTRLWKRWYRYLILDLWVVFAIGAFLGMLLPTILMRQAVALSGQVPERATVTTFVATVLRDEYGQGLFFLALLVGTLILFSTQLGIFEAMVRNLTDGANGISPGFRRMVAGDPRRFYFPFMFLLMIVIAIVIRLSPPVGLIQISANMSNFGALIYPFVLIYLNSKLPRAARPKWYHTVILLLVAVFFGFFFLNFVTEFFFQVPLVQF